MKKFTLTLALSLLFGGLISFSPLCADTFIDFTLVGTGTADFYNGEEDIIIPASDTITGNFDVSVGPGNQLTPIAGTLNPGSDLSTFDFSGTDGSFVGNVFTGTVYIAASGTNDRGIPVQNASFFVHLDGTTGTLEEDMGLAGSGTDTYKFSGPVTYTQEDGIDISVPEPNTIGLFLLGLAGVYGFHRFRAKRRAASLA